MNRKLTARQVDALTIIAHTGIVDEIDGRTLSSLRKRGLVELAADKGSTLLTDAGFRVWKDAAERRRIAVITKHETEAYEIADAITSGAPSQDDHVVTFVCSPTYFNGRFSQHTATCTCGEKSSPMTLSADAYTWARQHRADAITPGAPSLTKTFAATCPPHRTTDTQYAEWVVNCWETMIDENGHPVDPIVTLADQNAHVAWKSEAAKCRAFLAPKAEEVPAARYIARKHWQHNDFAVFDADTESYKLRGLTEREAETYAETLNGVVPANVEVNDEFADLLEAALEDDDEECDHYAQRITEDFGDDGIDYSDEDFFAPVEEMPACVIAAENLTESLFHLLIDVNSGSDRLALHFQPGGLLELERRGLIHKAVHDSAPRTFCWRATDLGKAVLAVRPMWDAS